MSLSATRVKDLESPGRYSDGDGVCLFIDKSGRRNWVQWTTNEGRSRGISLGGYLTDSLSWAKDARIGQPRGDWEREGPGSGKAQAIDAHIQ